MPDVDPETNALPSKAKGASRVSLPVVGMPPEIAATPARNIDILSYRPCDQACRQCSYVESETDRGHPRGSDAEVDFIRLVRSNYPDSVFFLYPRDVVTATPLLPIMEEIGQTETLTNGNRLDGALIDQSR